jgi:hypothetical protein
MDRASDDTEEAMGREQEGCAVPHENEGSTQKYDARQCVTKAGFWKCGGRLRLQGLRALGKYGRSRPTPMGGHRDSSRGHDISLRREGKY